MNLCAAPVFPETDRHFARKDGYQGKVLKAALPYCRNLRTAVDVGAHVGLITRQMLRYFERVVAFEPQPENFRCLVENAPKAELHNRALGDSPGFLSMHNPSPKNSGAWECLSEPGEVLTERLDSYGLKPDLIKYDVQGWELRALEGSEQTLRTYKPVVIVECWRDGQRDSAPREYLESLGALLVVKAGKDFIFAWKD